MPDDAYSPWSVTPPTSPPSAPQGPAGPPAPPAASPGPSGPSGTTRRERRSRPRNFLVGALVGGLCGAVVAAGVVTLVDDDGSSPSANPSTPAAVVKRASSTIGNQGDIANIIQSVEPGVVSVFVDLGGGQQAEGTGFVISSDGDIVTNAHVVEGSKDVKVEFTDGKQLDADVTGRDSAADIAVLDVNASNLPVVCLGSSDDVQVGDDVVAIGNALGLEGGLSVTRGIISGPPRPGTGVASGVENVLQTDTAINHGNSGGPLVNSDGCVIGINTAIEDQAQNVGFAIPIDHAKPIIDDIKAGRKPAFLGVGTTTLTPEIAEQLDVDADAGAVVESVTPGSPAADAGIKRGDVIVKVGDSEIADSGAIAPAVRNHRPGDTVEVTIVRGNDRQTVQATLVERPE
jgi:putative serine protease PepD